MTQQSALFGEMKAAEVVLHLPFRRAVSKTMQH